MIFGVQEGRPAIDGQMVKNFFEKYDQVKSNSNNVGWTMINEMFPESYLVKFSTSIDRERYQIKFLNP